MTIRTILSIAVYAILVELLTHASSSHAETWKFATTKKSDESPVYVDADYLIDRNGLVEVRIKLKADKNPLLLLLPDTEIEERYVVDCDTGSYGLVYQRTTGPLGTDVQRDALPSAVTMVSAAKGSIISIVSNWACPEFKKMLAAKRPAPPVPPPSTPNEAQVIQYVPDDALTKFRWKRIETGFLTKTEKETFDIYLAEDTVEVEKELAVFIARADYRPTEPPGRATTYYIVGQYAIGCNAKKFAYMGGLVLDRTGKVTERDPFNEKEMAATDIQSGSPAERYFQYICGSNANSASGSTKEPEQAAQGKGSFGTAWLSDRGYLVTAYHVVDGAREIAIRSRDGVVTDAKLVASDPQNDIAILSAAVGVVPGLPVARGLPGLGAKVFTIGYPHPELMGLSQKLTSGDISSLSGIRDDPRIMQISAPVQSGNSGGPLVNMSGEVVGMVSAKLSATQVLSRTGDLPQNVNYAVKARYVAGLLEDLPRTQVQPSQSKGAKAPRTLEELATAAQGAIFLILAR